jgi:glycosyltransferase involved in cell wall biosynthesis
MSHFSDLRMGGQRSMTHLIENLERTKYKPFALCPEKGELSEKLFSLGCPVFHVPMYSLKPKNILKCLPEAFHIRKIIKQNNIDIIHSDYPSDTYFAHLARLGTKTKVIWHVRWNVPAGKDRLFEKSFDGIIGVSEAAGKRFKLENSEISRKYETIYNGVDINKFSPLENKSELRKELDLPTGKFILLFAGVRKVGKGIFDILNAQVIIKNNNNNLPLMVFIGGDQANDNREKINKLIKENNISEDVRILPPQSNVSDWMRAADIIAIPSHEGNEGMPRVSIEAQCCGVPLILSDAGGVAEAIGDEQKAGIVVGQNSPQDIASAIQKIMSDENLAKKMSEAGRIRGEELFDIKIHARKIEKFYEYILSDYNLETKK